MCRKWKRTAALGLAVLIGGMMPMGTMLAAEDSTAVVQETDSVSDANEISDDEVISGENGSVDEEESAVDEVGACDENTGDEMNTDDGDNVDEAIADDENADEEADTVNGQSAGIEVMSEPEVVETSSGEVPENTDAPEIHITWSGDGKSYKYDLGGQIEYKYVNNQDQKFTFSAEKNGQTVNYYYYLDSNSAAEAKNSGDNIKWVGPQTEEMDQILGANANYVLYVKAVADGQTVYARSGGVVVDTIAPKIVGVEDGQTYSAGTTFTVSDANLSEVLINEQKAEPLEGGKYKVATQANSTSCVIRAKDKAGNSASCTITVSGSETPDTGNVISESKVYSLKAGVKYRLAAGNWKVDGDMSVYQGNSDFYVKSDGDYKFSK